MYLKSRGRARSTPQPRHRGCRTRWPWMDPGPEVAAGRVGRVKAARRDRGGGDDRPSPTGRAAQVFPASRRGQIVRRPTAGMSDPSLHRPRRRGRSSDTGGASARSEVWAPVRAGEVRQEHDAEPREKRPVSAADTGSALAGALAHRGLLRPSAPLSRRSGPPSLVELWQDLIGVALSPATSVAGLGSPAGNEPDRPGTGLAWEVMTPVAVPLMEHADVRRR
jgi:hypothetical protein